MPYQTRQNKEGFKVTAINSGKTFQFHSHDKNALENYLRIREGYSGGHKMKTHVKSYIRKGRPVRDHDRKVYGTIKWGKVKFPIASKEQKFLEAHNMPYSIVVEENGKKEVERMNTVKLKKKALFNEWGMHPDDKRKESEMYDNSEAQDEADQAGEDRYEFGETLKGLRKGMMVKKGYISNVEKEWQQHRSEWDKKQKEQQEWMEKNDIEEELDKLNKELSKGMMVKKKNLYDDFAKAKENRDKNQGSKELYDKYDKEMEDISLKENSLKHDDVDGGWW